jgi:hypothetical protein
MEFLLKPLLGSHYSENPPQISSQQMQMLARTAMYMTMSELTQLVSVLD